MRGNATIVHTNWNTEPKHLCFKVFFEDKTAYEAEKYCESIGGLLASIHTQEQNKLIHEKSNHTKTWIGLRFATVDANTREKHWIDHSPTDFENWDRNEPNNLGGEYCTVVNADGTWNDISCTRKFYFACQIESITRCD
ncbi:unnamed protein product [Cylicocyclus nassatus]|uniref:C-type lectin domain-containing protein n=1 Tax=Cylicocyclus nassatus TaxID=53992 RepID=A0AA36GVT6_CYLNA|nr:unnamed protein product [Cylicocyclus nassatus]